MRAHIFDGEKLAIDVEDGNLFAITSTSRA